MGATQRQRAGSMLMLFAYHVGQDATARGMHALRHLWRGNLARANGPDGFIGNHDAIQVFFRNSSKALFELHSTNSACQVLFVFRFRLANAQHDGHAQFHELETLSVDVFVRFAKENASFRMTGQCPLDANRL
jgi:hypothetical protein